MRHGEICSVSSQKSRSWAVPAILEDCLPSLLPAWTQEIFWDSVSRKGCHDPNNRQNRTPSPLHNNNSYCWIHTSYVQGIQLIALHAWPYLIFTMIKVALLSLCIWRNQGPIGWITILRSHWSHSWEEVKTGFESRSFSWLQFYTAHRIFLKQQSAAYADPSQWHNGDRSFKSPHGDQGFSRILGKDEASLLTGTGRIYTYCLNPWSCHLTI